MKILVTGGCGFIGSHICDALARHEIVALDNLSSGIRDRVTCPIEVVDICDMSALDGVFAALRPDIVVHCAAQVQVRKSLTDPIFDATQNILGTINVLECCRKYGVRKIIYTSTGGARYGEPVRLPAQEDDLLVPLSPYGISKHTAEHYITAYSKLYNIDSLILCFGNVYGPRDDPLTGRVMSLFITTMLAGKQPTIFGDGEQTRDFLYVKDVAKIVAENLATSPLYNLFNLSSGEATSVNQLFALLEHELQTGIVPLRGEAVTGEVRDIVLDITRAEHELGFVPTPLAIGLKETVAWFRR